MRARQQNSPASPMSSRRFSVRQAACSATYDCFRVRILICRIVSVAAGAFHNLALTAAGRVLAWGHSDYGQLGLGGTVHYATPRVVRAAAPAAGRAPGRRRRLLASQL